MKIKVTQAKVRKCIFDVLAGDIHQRIAIDIFAGTGSLGIEALNRGAKRVIFIEKDKRLASLIRDILKTCACGERADVWALDAFMGLSLLKEREFLFDIFFADPPYDYKETSMFLERFFSSGILKREAKGVVEHSRHLQLPEYPEFKKWKEKKFGETALTFYCGSRCGSRCGGVN